MNKKFDAMKFAEEYAGISGATKRQAFVDEKLEVESYVPVVRKRILTTGIVENTCVDDKTKKVKVDMFHRDLYTKLMLIEGWTNLKVDFGGINADPTYPYDLYDEMVRSGLFDYILSAIPETEIDTFVDMIETETSDLLVNNEIQVHNDLSSTAKAITALSGVFATLIESVSKEEV